MYATVGGVAKQSQAGMRRESSLTKQVQRTGTAEVAEVGQYGAQIARGNAKPSRQFFVVRVDRSRWNQTSAANVNRFTTAVQRIGEREWVIAPDVPTANLSAHHDVIAAPRVVGTLAVTRQRARKVGSGKRNHVIGHVQFFGCRLK
jgi:hypothetical protein